MEFIWPLKGWNHDVVPSWLNQPSGCSGYQDQSISLDLLEDEVQCHYYWNDWEVGDSRTIGQRYGAVVKKHDITNKILKQVKPILGIAAISSRSGIMMPLLLFRLCLTCGAWMGDLSRCVTGIRMICWWPTISMPCNMASSDDDCRTLAGRLGEFFYFINNLHIYDNQFEQAEELLPSRALWLPSALGLECAGRDQFLRRKSNQKILSWSIMIQWSHSWDLILI